MLHPINTIHHWAFDSLNSKPNYSSHHFSSKRFPSKPFDSAKKPKKTSGGIIRYLSDDKNYRYALVQGNYHKKWSFPKGHIKDGETSLYCAIREIYEETGINHLSSPITSLKIGYGYYYLFDVDEEYHLDPIDKNEIINTKWVTLEEMSKLDLNADVTQYLRILTI